MQLNRVQTTFLLGVLIGMGSCGRLQDPVQLSWDEHEKPDYAVRESWAALPQVEDPSDEVPKDLPSHLVGMDSLAVDVFFVHPTQYFKGAHWNASLADDAINQFTDDYPIRLQASAFQFGGRLYAPRYRQAHIGVFTWQDSLSWAALELAYDDVRDSFEHYLKHWNRGRGIILAGHSQGSWHLRWLIQEFFDGTPLQNQLVAAYAPGFDWYAEDFQEVHPCLQANQINCFCSWMSYAEGYFPPWLDGKKTKPVCTHPITWQNGTGRNDLAQHEGVVLSQMKFAHPHAIEVHVERGVLQIAEPLVPFGKFLQRNNWHVGDINLFWINIRENARLRAEAYLNASPPLPH